MPPTFRNIAIAIVLLGLGFNGYKQQLHLPKPSLNPFDDQWEMRTSWLRENCDIILGMCSDRSYEFPQETHRIGYSYLANDNELVRGKTLLVVADTIQLEKCKLYVDCWSINSFYSDSTYLATMDFRRLDSVCASFDFSRIDHLVIPKKSNPKFPDSFYPEESFPRYVSKTTGDTITFSLITQSTINDSLIVRDFYYFNGRDLNSFTRENQSTNL